MALTTLGLHLLKQHSYDADARDVAMIINQIVVGSKLVSRDINRAGLAGVLGSTGQINIQDEEVKKLDQLTNDTFIELFDQIPQVAAYASEELEDIVEYDHGSSGQYVVMMDPVDGSTNIDVNGSVGTIFGIYKKPKSTSSNVASLLQPGTKLIAAGYVLYGSSTIFVYSTGYGVHGFTLEPSLGEFLLSHEHLKFPALPSYYSINESYQANWDEQITQYVAEAKSKQTGRPAMGARYIGALVADFHRNLLEGGIYLYPGDKNRPSGKLRILFEAIPLGFLAVQAGGAASNGTKNILEIVPEKLHQRTPLFIGQKKEVVRIEKLYSSKQKK